MSCEEPNGTAAHRMWDAFGEGEKTSDHSAPVSHRLRGGEAPIGLVIGTYAALPYVHLQLEARRRLYPNVRALVHDDGSRQGAGIEALAHAKMKKRSLWFVMGVGVGILAAPAAKYSRVVLPQSVHYDEAVPIKVRNEVSHLVHSSYLLAADRWQTTILVVMHSAANLESMQNARLAMYNLPEDGYVQPIGSITEMREVAGMKNAIVLTIDRGYARSAARGLELGWDSKHP